MILPIEIFVIALVNSGADSTEVTGLDVVGAGADGVGDGAVGVGAATASTGTSRVGCAGLAVGTAGAGAGAGAGLVGTIGSTGLGVGVASTVGGTVVEGTVVEGTVVEGGSGTPGSSSYVTTEESFAVISESTAELSTSVASENELDDAGCWYSNAFVVPVGRAAMVVLVAVATNCVATWVGVIVGALPNMFATTPAT